MDRTFLVETVKLRGKYGKAYGKSMKKIFITLTMFFAAVNIMAQEHLSFKGIPIEGSMTEFCKKLKEKGFVYIGNESNVPLFSNIPVFSGNFTGDNATVGVFATDDRKNVVGVIVVLDPSGEWNILVNTYDYYKNLYTRKYGEPAVSEEDNPARLDSNIALMLEVQQGTAVYDSTWEVNGGFIVLSIQKTNVIYKGAVMIGYFNSQSMEAKIQGDLVDI